MIHGDIREPHGIFASPQLEELIDFGQPLGLLFAAVLHFIQPEDDPETAVRAFVKYLVPGSCLAVSHVTSDGTPPRRRRRDRGRVQDGQRPGRVPDRRPDPRIFRWPEPGLPRAWPT